MTAELTTLARRLGVDEGRLAALAAHTAEENGLLEHAVERAMEDEDRAFDRALTEALGFVPRLLRGPAQKLLFPGGGRG